MMICIDVKYILLPTSAQRPGSGLAPLYTPVHAAATKNTYRPRPLAPPPDTLILTSSPRTHFFGFRCTSSLFTACSMIRVAG